MHFNLDNKEYSFKLKNKEKKEKECCAFALLAHTLSSNQVILCVLVFGGALALTDLYQDKHTFKCHLVIFTKFNLFNLQSTKIVFLEKK